MPTKNEIDTGYPIEVAAGGTSDQSFVAYTPIVGGVTVSGALQSVASLGSANQVLVSNGPAALPSFQTITPAMNNGLVLLQTQQGSNTNLDFTTSVDTATYRNYLFFFSNVITTGGCGIQLFDSGSGLITTNYYVDNHWRAFNSTSYHSNAGAPTSGWGMGTIDTDFPMSGAFWLYFAADSANPYDPAVTGMFVTKQSGTLTLTQFMGYRDGNVALSGFRVSGVNTGTVSLYGLLRM